MNKANNAQTVAITGPAGSIGYALLFRIASGQVFGRETPINLHLLEVEAALPALEGVVMELEDCAFPLLRKVVTTSDPNVAMKNANWVVLVGAVPRKEGMERSDLLRINGGIFTGQGEAINAHAASDVRVLVVGNPCNTNCLIAMNNAKDVPRDRFYAMTMLDQNRAVAQLARKAKVPVSDIEHMVIWGNHSSTQYPDYFNATIQGKSAREVIRDDDWFVKTFIPQVQQRGAEVIKARGASSAASAANAIIDSLKALAFDTPKNTYYSMCRCSEGQYGVDDGLIFSFPCKTERGKVLVVDGIPHYDFGQQKITATLEELRQERDAVRVLGLI